MTKREVIEMLTAKAECIRREASGTDIDCNLRNCDECDLCYKQGTTGDQMEALRVAISALQAQDLQPTCNNLATDAISRQAAIDALGGNEPVGDPSKMDDDDVIKMWERIRIINIINKLPSAQPEPCEDAGEKTCRTCHLWEDGELNIACPWGSNYEHYEDDYCSLWEKQN